MFGTYEDNWRYSQGDIDAGTKVKQFRDSQILDLIIKNQRVTRNVKLLWKRHVFKNVVHREKYGERFQFVIDLNQVVGIHYKHIRGYILWRDWFELLETPRGGTHLSRVNREIVATVLNGSPVYRVPGQSITPSLAAKYPEAFGGELVSIEDIIS
jgi:hypothetical protein